MRDKMTNQELKELIEMLVEDLELYNECRLEDLYNNMPNEMKKLRDYLINEKKSVYDIKFPYSIKQIKDLARRLNGQAQDLNAEYGVNNADILEASFILSQADAIKEYKNE